MITSEEIKRRLWNGANELRGSMDASRYKVDWQPFFRQINSEQRSIA